MSVIIFAENSEGLFKKAVLEAATYAFKTASMLGTNAAAVVVGEVNNEQKNILSEYGISKIVQIPAPSKDFHVQSWTECVYEGFNHLNGTILVIPNTYTGKSLSPRLSVKLNASLATNVIELPRLESGFEIKRSVFSGKGYAYVTLQKDKKIIALTPNSIELEKNNTTMEEINLNVSTSNPSTSVIEINKAQGKIPLTEAEIVVSAGRGLKGPENWNMVEELANLLGAATACSKPVSDMGWRPHSEHVGQTGITIKPNLYIAIGISGAIQHLAGVSSSKVIVAINKDPEAPFFKAADYGIVGDAFEILPKLIESAKAL